MTLSTLLKTGTLTLAAGALTALLTTNFASGLYQAGRRYAQEAITTIMYPTISKESMEELNQLHQTFQNYLPIAPLKIVQSEECDGHSVDQVQVNSGCFTNEEFSEQGMQTVYHELAHSLQDHGNEPSHLEEYLHVGDAYTVLKRASDPFLMGISEYSPLFKIFDESTYVLDSNPDYGHPYDNQYELFASALTIFRFYPKEFAEKYQNLNTNNPHAGLVRDAATAVLDVLQIINPDKPNEMRKILPSYDRIRKVLELPQVKN